MEEPDQLLVKHPAILEVADVAELAQQDRDGHRAQADVDQLGPEVGRAVAEDIVEDEGGVEVLLLALPDVLGVLLVDLVPHVLDDELEAELLLGGGEEEPDEPSEESLLAFLLESADFDHFFHFSFAFDKEVAKLLIFDFIVFIEAIVLQAIPAQEFEFEPQISKILQNILFVNFNLIFVWAIY